MIRLALVAVAILIAALLLYPWPTSSPAAGFTGDDGAQARPEASQHSSDSDRSDRAVLNHLLGWSSEIAGALLDRSLVTQSVTDFCAYVLTLPSGSAHAFHADAQTLINVDSVGSVTLAKFAGGAHAPEGEYEIKVEFLNQPEFTLLQAQSAWLSIRMLLDAAGKIMALLVDLDIQPVLTPSQHRSLLETGPRPRGAFARIGTTSRWQPVTLTAAIDSHGDPSFESHIGEPTPFDVRWAAAEDLLVIEQAIAGLMASHDKARKE